MNNRIAEGFNSIAPVYDWLARLVFGKSLIRSQNHFVKSIPDRAKVLIIGGGSGRFLRYLCENKSLTEIWYVEISSAMITRAREFNKPFEDRIHFVCGDQRDIPPVGFDVVVTHFFMDMFRDQSLPSIVEKIKSASKPDSLWVIADFVNGQKWWQEFLLKAMYFFFRVTCQIETNRLPLWNSALIAQGFREQHAHWFYGGFVKSAVYAR